ncbi:hypothetical protein D048_4610 [Vibrio parahaemolyticus VPTS-2009]|nr:hypothetical protein D048_4610 [Vibrio parahaemolyticus VPTS-2009]
MKYENRAKNTRTLAINIAVLAAFFSLATNAALRGEQRDATQFKPLCHKHKS